MKTQMNLYVDLSTSEELRGRAESVNAPVGALADFLLRFALERVGEAVLVKWAQSRVSTRGRLGGGYTKAELQVLAAFEAQPGVWRQQLDELASAAGLKLSVAFWALKSLQQRGLVQGAELNEVDRWGRPVKSWWGLLSAMPERERTKSPEYVVELMTGLAAPPVVKPRVVVPPLPPRPAES